MTCKVAHTVPKSAKLSALSIPDSLVADSQTPFQHCILCPERLNQWLIRYCLVEHHLRPSCCIPVVPKRRYRLAQLDIRVARYRKRRKRLRERIDETRIVEEGWVVEHRDIDREGWEVVLEVHAMIAGRNCELGLRKESEDNFRVEQ